MVRKAEERDLPELAQMLWEMTSELWPDDASDNSDIYESVMRDHLQTFRDTVFVDDDYRGFFIIREETEPITPTRRVFNGIRVYIRPKYRHSRLLKSFYDKMFEEYPEGEIWGITEAHSDHIKVLDKRHTLVAKVYKLERR